jgi:RNA-directed DNA polymerase
MSRQRKMAAVLRLTRGADLELVSRSLGVTAAALTNWREGWIEYYGRYTPSALSTMLRSVNRTLLRWAMRKFKRFNAHKVRASHFLQKLARGDMGLFVHWRIGMTRTFA